MEEKTVISRQIAAPELVAAVLAMLCYAVTLGGTWIYDDILILRVDERLKTSIKFLQFWSQSYHNGVDNLYRPLVSTTYALQMALHGDRAWAFHLVNLLLHVAASILVAKLAKKLGGWLVGMIAGVLFAVHPIHVEAVANVVGRAELMCALGALGAMLLILRKPFTTQAAIGMVSCFIVSILSKEQGMLLPLMLAILWITQKWNRDSQAYQPAELQRLKIAGAAICILLGTYVFLRENVLGLKFWWDRIFLDWTINPLVRPDADRTFMPLVLLGRYVALLVAPFKLSPDYGATVIGWQVDWHHPWVYFGIAAIFTWFVLVAISVKRRDGAMIFCLISLAITYGIVGNIVSLIGTNFAERLMYLPSIFFVIIIALLIARLPRKAAITIVTVLAMLGIWRTVSYAAKWNNSSSFYEYCITHQPNAIRLRMLLVSDHLLRGDDAQKRGDQLTAENEFLQAKIEMDRTLKILPEYDEIWIQAASVAIAQKDYDAADQYLDEALRIAKADRRRSLLKASNWKNRVAELRAAATRPS